MRGAIVTITTLALAAVIASSAAAQATDGGCSVVPGATPSTATTPRIELRVLVLMDGVPIERAAAAMRVTREAYAPLGIDVVARYQTVDFDAETVSGLTEEA